MLELKNITKDYVVGIETIHILKGINLTIQDGEFVAIMGPSGSGKSTLMNIIGLLDRPTTGEYFLDEHDTSKLTDNDEAEFRGKKIGFIFQGYNLIPRLTALEQVMLPLDYQGMGATEKERLAKQALDRVGLSSKYDSRPTEMSGGQQQRVSIARAIVGAPSVLLADEPTGALDSKTGQEVLEIFRSLNDEGRTIVLITHDEKIGKAAKRMVKIFDGEIV
ncbi:MAG: ABC transporter ATP-binding protein [Candidatus Gracilibacteria bacterium]|nr:ABC transporter ATP-binding protein [Candidatus Gracilibacteria bacterium]